MSKDLELLRSKQHAIDEQLIVLLSERMVISREIGRIKAQEGLEVEQIPIWKETCETRERLAEHYGLDKNFVKQLFDVIHQQSINEQKNG
jgi:chorismate mutase